MRRGCRMWRATCRRCCAPRRPRTWCGSTPPGWGAGAARRCGRRLARFWAAGAACGRAGAALRPARRDSCPRCFVLARTWESEAASRQRAAVWRASGRPEVAGHLPARCFGRDAASCQRTCHWVGTATALRDEHVKALQHTASSVWYTSKRGAFKGDFGQAACM